MCRRDKDWEEDLPGPRCFRFFLAVMWLIFRSLSLLGAEAPPECPAAATAAVRTIKAVRVDSPPVIDGMLDDACWRDAPAATGFVAHDTDKPARDQTVIRVLYDDRVLFVAFECLESEPEKIQATERKYDRGLWDDDWVEVVLDTFHDHRNRYVLIANTLFFITNNFSIMDERSCIFCCCR